MRYNVELREDGGSFTTVLRDFSGTATNVSNLQSSTNYSVRVSANNTVGEGPYSDIVNFTTSDVPVAAPVNVTVRVADFFHARR